MPTRAPAPAVLRRSVVQAAPVGLPHLVARAARVDVHPLEALMVPAVRRLPEGSPMLRPASVILLAALCVLVGVALPARAHDPSLSGIRILYRREDVVVNVTTHLSRLEKAEGRDKGAMSS